MTEDLRTVPALADVGKEHAVREGWRALLYGRLANQPSPVVVVSDSVRSAASLWTGLRAWVSTFRAAGFTHGDVVISTLPPNDALLQLALACMWESLPLVLAGEIPDGPDVASHVEALLVQHDAQCVVHPSCNASHVLRPETGGWPRPPDAAWQARPAGTTRRDAGSAHAQSEQMLRPDAQSLDEARRYLARAAFANTRLLTLCRWQNQPALWRAVILPLLQADELFLLDDQSNESEIANLLENEPITHVLVDGSTPPTTHFLLQRFEARVVDVRSDVL